MAPVPLGENFLTKCVSNLPARKSGSAMIFWWMGIEVEIPSTTNMPKARAMRLIASDRSFPCTTSLAISES